MLGELLRARVECIGEKPIVHIQDVYDHTLRVLDLVESQRELLTGLLEAQLAVQSNQMNQVMKATSSWGAILIVATLIAGIYGMNFEHMPELRWDFGYPFALGTDGRRHQIVLYRVQASGLAVAGRPSPCVPGRRSRLRMRRSNELERDAPPARR